MMKRILSLVVFIVLIAMASATTAVDAEIDDAFPGSFEIDDEAKNTITAFAPLPQEVVRQTVPPGDLTLPVALEATIDGAAGVVQGVTWQSTPEYDSGAEGEYLFAPEIPTEYTVEEGVALPEIAVTVEGAAFRLQTVVITIAADGQGQTALHLPAGSPLTDDDLLAGVSGVDETGNDIPVAVNDTGGLDMQRPAPNADPATPYIITYEAVHPETGESFTATREVFVEAARSLALVGSDSSPENPAMSYEELRDAIIAANADPGVDTIYVAGSFTLPWALPEIIEDLIIIGDGQSTTNITVGGNFRHFTGTAFTTLTLENLTLTGRRTASGGGVYTGYGGTATLTDCTLTGNSAGSDGGGVRASTATIRGSIVAGNTRSDGTKNELYIEGDIFGSGTNYNGNGSVEETGAYGEYYIVGVPDGGLGILFEVDGSGKPVLKDNGGPTQTIALAENSPAIGKILNGTIWLPALDQRGYLRGANGYASIGAYEAGGVPPGVRGDLNGDGDIDISDVSRVAYMVVGKVPADPAADFNGNGKVDIGDAAKIACYLVGKIPAL